MCLILNFFSKTYIMNLLVVLQMQMNSTNYNQQMNYHVILLIRLDDLLGDIHKLPSSLNSKACM